MKVLYHFRTQGTGAEGVHIAGIANAFEELGHKVFFSSPTGIDPRLSAGANPFAPKRRSWLGLLAAMLPGLLFECLELGYNLFALWRNLRFAGKLQPDLIYERHAFFLFSTALLARIRGIPLVVEVNELAGDERVRATPWLLPLAVLADRITFKTARVIVVVSPHLKRRIAALGIAPDKILVLPNAVSAESLDHPADGAAVREKLGLQDAIIIGFVGWFVEWHRLDLLLEQVATLASDEPRVRLMLIGDGALKETLVEQAAHLGIGERAIFTGAVPHAQVPDYIAAMDICVVPHSNAYRSPIKLFEFMARGRAVIAPRTEPVASVITDGENGLLFDPEQPDELGARLKRLAVDAPLRERLGTRAREDVRSRHTWKRNAKSVLATMHAPAEDY